MNTVKIIKLKAGFACEFHGSGPISIQEYSGFATGDMANDAAEWCSRTTQVASTQEIVCCVKCGAIEGQCNCWAQSPPIPGDAFHDDPGNFMMPAWQPTKEELEAQSPQAYISETDKVFCSECWEEAQEDNVGDQDPNCWLHATKPWSNHVCDCCGSTDGHPAF